MTNTLTISIENLVHFQCPYCKGWWSVGDAPKREYWFCPWCGKASAPPGDYMPEHPSGEGQWYIEDMARQEKPIEGVGQIVEIMNRPDLITGDESDPVNDYIFKKNDELYRRLID